MSQEQKYKREGNGQRFQMSGMNTVLPPDVLQDKYVFLQNVRAYLQGRMRARALQTAPQQTLSSAVHSLRRLNDTTPLGPASGFALISGADEFLFCNSTPTLGGFSSNPLAFIPFRPNQSPQPWMYVGDSLKMAKIRSDGLTYKMGVKEPQTAPIIGTDTTTVSGNVTVLGTARPWSNVSSLNSTFGYGDNGNGTGTVIIATPIAGATVTLTATGTAVVNGVAHNPGDLGGTGASNPGQFMSGAICAILCGAWTNSSGVIVAGAGAGAISIGAAVTLTVPPGATQLQLGIDGIGGNFSANTGSFAVAFSIATSSVSTVVSLIGDVTAYYWGDSPTSGSVANYVWKNAADTGGDGPVRTISDAVGSTTNNSLVFDTTPADGTTPMQWTTLDSTGAPIGVKPVYQPALHSQGYQDFNMVVTANLFIPAAGTYTFTALSKDNVMWGIGNNATWPGIGSITGRGSQNQTVNGKFPLLPMPTVDGAGPAHSVAVAVTFPGPGVYPIELNYDYWYRFGRTLVITVNGVNIPPLGGSVRTNVTYRYTFRGSETGATSNPSPASLVASVPSISNTVLPEFSPDPQVDKVDYYRMDSTLDMYTYVGTGPNTNPPTPFTDQALDSEVVGNPLLQFDNYEPFPSIDLPKSGVVNVIGGVVQRVSGDEFNVRWLPGTIINIGGIDYRLYNRPGSANTLLAVDVADGLGLVYEIAEPILAAQPMASMFGDTDNTAFVFACGDKLRPGTLYWCKGNNLDSAPDTNQQDVTSPSEPLINGVIANGIGMIFSAENGWTIYPNFTSALASVTGVAGSAFSLIRSGVTRGLYIRTCICADGSGSYFYRSKDGIEMSSGGGQQKSLTDGDLFNLFPHEGFLPYPVTRAGYTAYPPDDTQPELQHLRFATGYLYYDYVDTSGTRRSLVFDVAGSGWVTDSYQWPVTVHILEEGPNANGVYTGSTDGTIRVLSDTGIEAATCVVLTASNNGGDARAFKNIGDLFLRAQVTGSAVNVTPYADQYAQAMGGATVASLAPGAGLQPYIVDFADGDGREVIDLALLLTWAAGTTTFLDLWQPNWTDLPETTQDRPTDWEDAGLEGAGFWQGLTLEADTFNQPKAIAVQSGDDLSLHVPDQSPITFNGQSKQPLSFTPPFVAHSVRIVTTDNVPWRYFGAKWVRLIFPQLVEQWQTEMTSMGSNHWQTIFEINVAYLSTTNLTLTMVFDPGARPAQIVMTVPSSGGLQAKLKMTVPANKFKLVSFRLNASAKFRVFANDWELKIGAWGRQDPYRNLEPIGAMSERGATL